MTTEADIGHGTTVEMGASGEDEAPFTYAELGEVTSVSPPPMTRDIIDATHMASPNRWREFIAGLRDGGEITIGMNFVPASSTTTQLLAAQTEETPRRIRITFPDGTAWGFMAYCTGFTPEVPVDDKMTTEATFKVTGEPDFTDPS